MKSITKKALPILALILLACLSTATNVQAATLCVEPSGAGGCYTTIQAAIDAASPGDVIEVSAGTYVEDLVVDKALTLTGPNAATNPNTGPRAAEAVIVSALSAPDPYTSCTIMMYIESSNVAVRGFTFDGDNPALTSGLDINGADVDGCEGISSYEGVGNISIEYNIIRNISYAAIDLYNYVNNNATSNNYIRYNLIENIGSSTYGFGVGTLIYNNFYADITHNVYDHVRVGIQTGNFYRANVGPTGSISNNIIDSPRLGIFHNLWYSAASVIPVSNNTINAVDSTDSTKFYGMLISSWQQTANTTITDNTINIGDVSQTETGGYNIWNTPTTAALTISGGTVNGGMYGVFVNNYEGYSSNGGNTSIIVDNVAIRHATSAAIYVKDSPSNTNNATVRATVRNSTITGSEIGVWVLGGDARAIVENNILTGGNYSARIESDGEANFTCNGIYNNSIGMLNLTGDTIVAEDNWWGDPSGPTHSSNPSGTGDAVSDDIDFDPWNTPTPGCAPGELPDLLVSTSSPATGTSLNASISALTVTFDQDVVTGGGLDAADNLDNYLLVEAGLNGTFDTLSCAGGVVADDVIQLLASAVYANGAGTGPYIVTLTTYAPLADGTYRLFVCGTTSIWSVAGAQLNNGTSDSIIDFNISSAQGGTSSPLPATGFPQGMISSLPVQPVEKAYSASDMILEIPSLNVAAPIVGVPQSADGWDTTWLGQSVGYLYGSAYPTWAGNTVITGHVWDNNNNPGPFAELKDLKFGDQIQIHAFGQTYTYEVRESSLVGPRSTSKVFQHEEYDWLTLMTCEFYNPLNQNYLSRRVVRAVLIEVSPQ